MLHLRQICLAESELEPAISDLAAILAAPICVRDFHVDIYGLTNALVALGSDFIEIVAPIEENTAVRRFLGKSGGRGAYMAIFQCDDPERRQRHVGALGVRTPHIIDRPEYRNVQLHPKDCRATILEFARNGDYSADDWWPAGPDWRGVVDGKENLPELLGVVIESPDPGGLARLWSEIIELPLQKSGGALFIAVNGRRLTFSPGDGERVSALMVSVDDPSRALDEARRRGRSVLADGFRLAGVDFILSERGGSRRHA
ncbi:MAG: hypothetical protein BGP06_05350 [Rhizobiales bacterium 65-9]|nr:VOC family protein [Hyphomicrobiales bacterium]OJY35310.1 MAG: hypothetical protein BGP06_05350 [Rhizobiales bacterium 65-9]